MPEERHIVPRIPALSVFQFRAVPPLKFQTEQPPHKKAAPEGHWHDPFEQTRPPVQLLLGVHSTHWPLEQNGVAVEQTFPQTPQLLVLVFVSTQVPLQSVPEEQVHEPAPVHRLPAGQALRSCHQPSVPHCWGRPLALH